MGKKWWFSDKENSKHTLLENRSLIIKQIRRFFDEKGFWEVETPALQICPGMEVHLKAFRTELVETFETDKREFYLHTSPELTMKKLLVAGWDKIYQMTHVFRNEERSLHHHPEFTMLEWYQTGADYKEIMKQTEDLVKSCAEMLQITTLKNGGIENEIFSPWEYLSVQEAFLKYAGIDILSTVKTESLCKSTLNESAEAGVLSENTKNAERAERTEILEPDPSLLRAQAEKSGIKTSANDRWEDIFFRVMLEKVEPHLGQTVPTFLYDYPVALGALAKKSATNPKVAERFEVYACGVELGNAFSELTDAHEQRIRFEHDQKMKKELYGYTYPLDEDFLDALTTGLPACAGIAIGVDRLVMLLLGADKIDDILWAPVA
jgi:elongation factor P--(R)-beta-lysine ligase